MAGERPRVVIIGGGPGGLALAQGLKKAGMKTAIYEKSPVRGDYVQGFRLRIQQKGLDALEACLPSHLFKAFLETLGRSPGQSLQFDEHLRPLPEQPGERDVDEHRCKSVSRITLRQVLLSGLEDVLHTGRSFSHYELHDDDTVTAWFEDGGSVRADLLVGADGAGSRVRGQLLPHAEVFDTGGRRLAGKITLAEAQRVGLADMFFTHNVGIESAMGPRLGVSVHRVDRSTFQRHGLIGGDDPTHLGIEGLHFDNTTSYIWWNIAFARDNLVPDKALFALDGVSLLKVLERKMAGWHADVIKLVASSAPSTVAALRVRSSRPVDPWPTGTVTLLGDAIHAMTYFRALGGNSALHDAALLTDRLTSCLPLGQVVASYEAAMRDHGYEAVRGSLAAFERSLSPLVA